ncbi:GNAT family N-acetyltransferase [Paenibacillus athensensis]|uniref:N-acetyltransferase domain-containing protein n=1 Tax=Paenibacillus athensensis TaxID=1967502 RepID=A0A4Y8QAL4_9BACL|nr:GNAT family N-acetyltransferase [Paenibacillus athensensis]MCD1260016.1 GNAT family N-acetyltransferase [Paenibacillus athensensis]
MLLKPIWQTEKLLITDIALEEIHDLQHLYETSSNLLHWDGREPDPAYVNQCYHVGDLPPDGLKENYKLQAIKRGKELVGFISLYHGYPHADTAYLSFLCMGNHFKGRGYGREVVQQLVSELQALHFKEIRINVSLKNWQALRFWIQNGFTKLNGMYGDREYSKEATGSLELCRSI